jgi:multidrug efflux pump subunit AcrA (membrane-fusion protein)
MMRMTMETLRALFLVVLTLSVSCRSREPAAQRPSAVTVTASRVARQPLASEISLGGSTVGQKTVRLGFMVAGKIDMIGAHEGDPVRAQQRLAGKSLADTRLFAPLSGVLLRRTTEPGEIVPQGTPLFVLAAIDTIKIEAAVPESELREVRLGQPADVDVTPLDAHCPGTVTQVGSAADPASRTYTTGWTGSSAIRARSWPGA